MENIEKFADRVLASYVAGAEDQNYSELRAKVVACYDEAAGIGAVELDHLWDCACGECYEEDCHVQQKYTLLYEIMVDACACPE